MINPVHFYEHISAFQFIKPECNVAPFQTIHSVFYQFMIELCRLEGEYVMIAGSAALDQEMRRIHHKTVYPNNVVFFTLIVILTGEKGDSQRVCPLSHSALPLTGSPYIVCLHATGIDRDALFCAHSAFPCSALCSSSLHS